MCCNTDNPEDLDVSMRDCQLVMQSAADPDVFYVKGGVTAITGSKHSDLTKDIDQPASTLKEIPKRDPDIVEIDGKTFRQTGTVYTQGPLYLVILER